MPNGELALKRTYFYILIAAVLFVAGYYDVFLWMYERYMGEDSYYSHGFLIPFVVGYLIWLQRKELAKLPISSSKLGLVLIVLAILIHLFGTAVYVYSVSGFSIWIMIFGLTLFLYGWGVTRCILFPLAFLFFMFPLPSAIITMISFPLKMLVANLGVKIVAGFGIPVFQEGFNISIPQGELLVGNPCSGLRSLIAFLALGSLMAYLSCLTLTKQIILSFFTVPIAILSNLIRVPILILWSYKWGIESAAPDTLVHTMSGFLVFLLGACLLWLLMWCMERKNEQ